MKHTMKLHWWTRKKLLRGRVNPIWYKVFRFCLVLVSYLDDLVDGFLVDRQAGKGIFTEALGEGTKCQQTLRVDLQQKVMMM